MKSNLFRVWIIPCLLMTMISTSCESLLEEPPYNKHEVSGQIFMAMPNLDPHKGTLYSATKELVPCPKCEVTVFDVQTYKKLLGWEILEHGVSLTTDDKGCFEVTTTGIDKYIHVKAHHYADINLKYEADTVIKYKNKRSYKDLKIVMRPRLVNFTLTPNPAHVGDSLKIYFKKLDMDVEAVLRFHDKVTGEVVDSVSFVCPRDSVGLGGNIQKFKMPMSLCAETVYDAELVVHKHRSNYIFDEILHLDSGVLK